MTEFEIALFYIECIYPFYLNTNIPEFGNCECMSDFFLKSVATH